MIFLIDDTPVQMLEEYLKLSDYADILKREENFSSDDIFSLTWASCVLMHSSFHDAKLKSKILNYVGYGDTAPVVLFSDGDSPEAEFNGDNYIISIKKRVFYSRLKRFLDEFRETKVINLKLLAVDEAQKPKQTTVALGDGNVFKDFFSQYKLEVEPEKKEEKPAGPVVYCVGRDGMDKLASVAEGVFVSAPVSELKSSEIRKQDANIHDFIAGHFPEEVKALVLDTDADPALFMRFALHFRLTETLKGKSKFAPIVFVSDLPLEKLLKKGFESQIFMTGAVHLCTRGALTVKLESIGPLEENSYKGSFLERISIPAPKGSNHSLANQWGASRLYMIIKGQSAEKDIFKGFQDIHKDLYFKYVFHRIPPSHKSASGNTEEFKVRGDLGKRILLIDDEAEKGWTRTLSLLFPLSRFQPKEDVIAESVMDYESLSEGARAKIESGEYDLILLDLRLGGIREDYVVEPEDMSGYKILKRIKELNRGNQVIMLTASNKVWNLKALMQPGLGADGYFVKESPEYEFSDELSAENLRSLISDAERCLRHGYLRDYWRFVQSFNDPDKELVNEVKAQLDIAYDMAARATTPDQYNYAFLALYQVLELVTFKLTGWNIDSSNKDMKLLTIDEATPVKEIAYPKDAEVVTGQKPFAWQKTPKNGIFPQKDKLAALYLQKWGKQDRGILFLMIQMIAIRNSFIHPENSALFDLASPLKDVAITQLKYFNDSSLVFSEPEFKSLFREAAAAGLLYADSKGRPTLHRDVATSALGIRFLLTCYKDFLTAILP